MEQSTNNAPRRGRPPKTVEFAKTHPHAFTESLADLEARVAQAEPGDWIETTPENMKTIFKRGLSGKLYGLYRGALLCELGNYETIEKEHAKEVDELLFPGISGKNDL